MDDPQALSARLRPWGIVACLLAGLPFSCEKKTAPPQNETHDVQQPIVTTPSALTSQSASELPSATRFNQALEISESELPDLPDNPDVPKPNFPGIAGYAKNEVISCYTDALKAPDDAEKIGVLGMVFYRLNAATETIHCFERAVKLAPTEFRWRYYLGLAYGIAFESQQAIDTMKKAAELDPDYAAIPVRLGDLARDMDVSLARSYYEQALKKTPTDCRVHYGLGMCAMKEKREDDAMTHLNRAVELAPKYAEAHQVLARLHRQKGDKAKADVHQALADQGGLPPVLKDPLYIDLVARITGPEPLMSITRQLIETSQADLALKILERALRWNPNAWDLHHQIAMALLQQSRPLEAIQEFRLILDNDPGRNFVRPFLAQALVDTGSFREAEKLLKEEMQRRPDDPDPFGRYADFLLTSGHVKEAEEMFQRMVRAEPGHPINELGLIASLVCLKRNDAAVERYKLLQSHVQEGYDMAATLVGQLLILIAEQSRTDAEQYRKRTINPDDLAHFGDRLKAAGLDAAGRKFESYLDTTAANAVELAKRGDLKPAIRMIQKTISLDRGGVLRDGFCSIFTHLYRKDRGIGENFLAEYIRHAPDAPDLALVVAWILATSPEDSLRNGATAVQIAQRLCDQSSGPEALDTLAAAFAEAGRFDEAVQTMQKALAAPVDNDKAKAMRDGPFRQRLDLYRTNKPYRCSR